MWQFEQPVSWESSFLSFLGRIARNRLSALRRANAARPGARQREGSPEARNPPAQGHPPSPFLGVRDATSVMKVGKLCPVAHLMSLQRGWNSSVHPETEVR